MSNSIFLSMLSLSLVEVFLMIQNPRFPPLQHFSLLAWLALLSPSHSQTKLLLVTFLICYTLKERRFHATRDSHGITVVRICFSHDIYLNVSILHVNHGWTCSMIKLTVDYWYQVPGTCYNQDYLAPSLVNTQRTMTSDFASLA